MVIFSYEQYVGPELVNYIIAEYFTLVIHNPIAAMC